MTSELDQPSEDRTIVIDPVQVAQHRVLNELSIITCILAQHSSCGTVYCPNDIETSIIN